jgi:uncharacterized protein YihD (DUF1040 family)
MEKKTEIRNLLERLRIAWEKRPEMELAEIIMDAHPNTDFHGFSLTDTKLFTAIEKLCEGEV